MVNLRRWRSLVLVAGATAVAPSIAALSAQQPNDAEYTAKIRELTPTDPKWKFSTELVDHLPASSKVPTPLKVLGYVPGTIGRLSRTEDLNKYFRAVAAASPRVKVFSLGMSEEGREMIIAAVADENTIKRLDDYRAMAARLADPRGVSDAERARLIRDAKPLYWLTGTIHAPETGSPEMLMELLYRLAVEETPFVQKIRNNVITLITPATEVDGRNRIVDIIDEEKQLKLGRGGIPTVYWGKYIAHDNNRDGLMMSIKLTQNVNAGFLYWRPTIMHDLHESVPFLYTSTGTGPYNDEFDPITVGEWHTLAYQEINELTKRGLPGVWTHGFYDGWAPNYMLGIAQFRNSMGKFYETYTSGGADCQIVNLPGSATSKEWFRPNPPVNNIKWCIRSNINYQQSGVLVALKFVADNRETFVENFALKATRMVERGKTSAPYAFVIPHDQRHAAEAADLVDYFRKVGSEVHVATGAFTARDMPAVIERGLVAGGAGPAVAAGGRGGRGSRGNDSSAARTDSIHAGRSVNVAAGDWIVRMDQPYTALIRTVLAVQKFRPDDPSPYDDTGWSLDQLRHVTVYTIADSSVLTKPMTLLKEDARVNGVVAGNGGTLIVQHSGDWRSAMLPWKVGSTKLTIADSAFAVSGTTYPAGTYIVDNGASVRDALTQLGMKATAVSSAPTVRSHVVQLPRIAFIHTWIETQNEGWVRHALEEMGVPFTYMSTQRLKEPGLLDRFDVVLFPHVSGPTTAMVNGKPMVGPAVPWKASALTPSLGKIDSTDDIRPELGLDGLSALRRFVERGGLLLVEGNTSRLPIDFGFTPSVSVAATPRLLARGAIFRAEAVTRSSPILYGYDRGAIPVYFNTAPLLTVASGRGGGEGGAGGGTSAADEERSMSVALNRPDPSIAKQTAAMRPRVILRFDQNVDSLLISGLLDNGSEMTGKAAVVDAPLGQGHVILFGIRPMWRYETQGSYAMVLNALANWNALDVNERTQRVATDGGDAQNHN